MLEHFSNEAKGPSWVHSDPYVHDRLAFIYDKFFNRPFAAASIANLEVGLQSIAQFCMWAEPADCTEQLSAFGRCLQKSKACCRMRWRQVMINVVLQVVVWCASRIRQAQPLPMPDRRANASPRPSGPGPVIDPRQGAGTAPVLGAGAGSNSSTTNGIRRRHLPLDLAHRFAKTALGLDADDTPSPLEMRKSVAWSVAAGAREYIRARHHAVSGARSSDTNSNRLKDPSVAPTGFPTDVPPCRIMSAVALAANAVLHSHGERKFVEIHGHAVCGTIAMKPVLRDGVLEILLVDASRAAILLRGHVPCGTAMVCIHLRNCVWLRS